MYRSRITSGSVALFVALAACVPAIAQHGPSPTPSRSSARPAYVTVPGNLIGLALSSGYRVRSVVGAGPFLPGGHQRETTMTVRFTNTGKRIPRFILRIDSFGTYRVTGISGTRFHGNHRVPVTPSRQRATVFRGTKRSFGVAEDAGAIYVYDFGALDRGARLVVRASVTSAHPKRYNEWIMAYGRENAQGLPDWHALVWNGSACVIRHTHMGFCEKPPSALR